MAIMLNLHYMDLYNLLIHSCKEIVGYEPEELLRDDVDDDDLIHPADLSSLIPSKQFCE